MFKENKKLRVFVVFVIILVLILILKAYLTPKTGSEIFNDSIRSVVELKASSDTKGESYGTAVFVSDEGELVTNAHIITYKDKGEEKCFEELSIRFADEDKYHSVKLIKYDVEKDLALLELEDKTVKFEKMKLGRSKDLYFGQDVYAIGNSMNYGISITKGIISIPVVNIEYDGNVREVIQSDLTIASGNSGGALIDQTGKLVGITAFRTKDNKGNVVYGYAFSIPIEKVIEYIK